MRTVTDHPLVAWGLVVGSILSLVFFGVRVYVYLEHVEGITLDTRVEMANLKETVLAGLQLERELDASWKLTDDNAYTALGAAIHTFSTQTVDEISESKDFQSLEHAALRTEIVTQAQRVQAALADLNYRVGLLVGHHELETP